jgi:hypothetical protein
MLARQNPTILVMAALLSVLLSLPAAAQDQEDGDSPSSVTNQYLLTAQRFAKIWVETKPWPSRYPEFLSLAKEEFAPMLSQQALLELQAKPETGPQELLKAIKDPTVEDDEVYEGMMACVANAHFTVLSESIQGDQATVDVETTVADAFGSGKTESFQDQLVLIKENGRWVLTPQAFKTFAF